MGTLSHLHKKKSSPLEDIAEEIVTSRSAIKSLLILYVNHDGTVSYQMYDPDSDLGNMLMAHKLCGLELDDLIKDTYSG
jgi:hypothetical protein